MLGTAVVTPIAMKKFRADFVPCPCPTCRGARVSKYIRAQHMRRYVRRGEKQRAETPVTTTSATPSLAAMQPMPLSSVNPTAATLPQSDYSQPSSASASESDNSDGGNDLENLDAYEMDVQEPEQSQVEFSECAAVDSDPFLATQSDSEVAALYDMSIYDAPIANVPLYAGARTTLLEAVAEHLLWFSEHPGISKEALSDMLHLQHHSILPAGNVLPQGYEAALKLVEPFLITPVVFHACPNDCIIFRGDHIHLDKCPHCQSNRYISGTIPAKRFTYLPLGPRLEHMFGTEKLSQIVQSHCSRSDDSVYDIHDSKAWKQAYSAQGIFAGDRRGISLAVCTDGVNPFSQNRVSYSMWPVVMTILNLPRHSRYSSSSLFLVGIIPGNGTKEPKSLQPYLEIMVDEILALTNRSVYDAYRKAPFSLKVEVLLYTLDYPGIGKVFNTMGSGAYQACVWCDVKGTRFSSLDKVVYLQNRRYLPVDSELRRDCTNFPDKQAEQQPPPTQRVYSILKKSHRSYDHAKNKSQAAMIATATGCKSSYVLMKLPHHDRITQIFPDAMHTIKDAMEHVFNIIVGKEDSVKVRKAERELGRFGIASISADDQTLGKKRSRSATQRLPTVPFRLSDDDIKIANERVTSVILPSHDFTPKCIFTKSTGLKSHDWKELICKGVLKYALRGMLGPQQRSTFFHFSDALSQLFSEKHEEMRLPELKEEVNLALALMERDFPIAIQVITMHLLRHIVDGIELYGPVYSTWMFAYERFNSWITRRVTNRRHPEATVMETYRIYEWCQYMVSSGRLHSATSTGVADPTDAAVINLSDEDIGLLNATAHPRYSCLCKQYDEALQRATNARRKSTFPCFAEWEPPGGYQDGDRELLQGPGQNKVATNYKRIIRECPNTGRKIVLSAASFDLAQSRHSFSYVRVIGAEEDSPIFCHIQKLISHKFSNNINDVAIVKQFNNTYKDSDSGLWYVSSVDFMYVALLLKDISQPLAVAFDSTTYGPVVSQCLVCVFVL